MRKSSVILASLATLASTAALATDLPLSSQSVWNWSGFYAGVHGGFGGDKFDYPFNVGSPTFPNAVNGSLSLNSSGFYGGAHAGYNWQFNRNWVAGIEADINAADIEGKVNGNINIGAPLSSPATNINADAGSKVDYFGTLRARFGWTNGPLLLYATGGFAYGDTTSDINASINGTSIFSASQTNHHTGWTIGGGVEYALTPHVSLKTEYKWVDLGTQNLITAPIGGGATASLSETTKFHTIEVGLNYRF